MYDGFYKRQIIKRMIQAAQVELLGLFSEGGEITKIDSGSIEEYKNHFINQALFEAKEYVISRMNDIDYSVEE